MNKIWRFNDGNFYLSDITNSTDKLETKIYITQEDPKTLSVYLRELSNYFKFDFKIYGLEKEFIDRIVKTYENSNGNLGVLLNGIRGTGKTITAELLANELKLPVIIVSKNHKGITDFLSNINQDVSILIDEYEKVFRGNLMDDDNNYENSRSEKDSTLLSIMDGVYNTEHRKVFILTTNSLWINENLLNRPGRIRYLKEFSDLTLKQVDEIINDMLKERKFKEDVRSFLVPLKIITVDIVKAIIQEVNIHNESPYDCCKDFNIQYKDTIYNVIDITNNEEILLHSEVSEKYLSHIINPEIPWKNRGIHLDGIYYRLYSEPDYNKMIFYLQKGSAEEVITVRIKKLEKRHNIFL